MDRLKKIGMVKAKNSAEIKNSKFGLGFEKLDRNVFDPEKAYDKVAATGVKWIRLQSGWARTEKEKGVYDFSWLDDIVDNLLKRGLIPWMCLCYGNGLYDEAAAKVYGAVGCPPIHNNEQKMAWKNYVYAVVEHFKGRITYYEIWNEPDGRWCWKHGVNPEEMASLTLITAESIRKADSDAKIIGGVVCLRDLQYINTAFDFGIANVIDAVSFHEYTPHDEYITERAESLRALAHIYNPKLEIIQGESGSQSRGDCAGALAGAAWTEKRQAKQLLRHAVMDIISNVKFTSYFSCVDMIEAMHGTEGDASSILDYAFFGILKTEFDEKGFACGEYTPKPAYRSLQTIASMLSEEYKIVEMPILFTPDKESLRMLGSEPERKSFITVGIEKPNGSHAFIYWHKDDLMTTDYEGTISMQTAGLGKEIKLVDMFDGSVYELNENMITDLGHNCYKFNNIPTRDYPLALIFGDFLI